MCGVSSLCLDQEDPPERTKLDDPHVLSGAVHTSTPSHIKHGTMSPVKILSTHLITYLCLLTQTGISFCFGDEYGYYMPLPCIPALLSLPHTTHHPSEPGLSHSAPHDRFPGQSDGLHTSHLRSNATSASSHLPLYRSSHPHPSPASMNSLFTSQYSVSPTPSGQDWDPAVLICRYVGFPLILDKCPYLKSKVSVTVAKKSEKNTSNSDGSTTGMKIQVLVPDPPRSYKDWVLQQRHKEESLIKDRNKDSSIDAPAGVPVISSAAMNCSNSLVSVSKQWTAACRAALCLEWRRGSCAEWRVVSELMSSDRVTKVTHYPPTHTQTHTHTRTHTHALHTQLFSYILQSRYRSQHLFYYHIFSIKFFSSLRWDSI